MSEETLYSVFKQTTSGLKTARQEADKLKAINSTGRVDFVIQVCPAHTLGMNGSKFGRKGYLRLHIYLLLQHICNTGTTRM